MSADVIDRVHTLARCSGASLGLTFADRDGNLIVTADDESFHSSDNDDASDDGASYDAPSQNEADAADLVPIEGVYQDETEYNDEDNDENNDIQNEDREDRAENLGAGVHFNEGASTNENASDDDVDENHDNDDIDGNPDPNTTENGGKTADAEAMDAKYGARSGQYELRTRRPRN